MKTRGKKWQLSLSPSLVIWSAVLLSCLINPGFAQAATGEKWWEHSYEGGVLPSQAQPGWGLVEPDAKAGMVIDDKISDDGGLLMTIKGTAATHYYQCAWDGSGRAWTGSSELGSTAEFKIRVTEEVPNVSYACLFSFGGFGPEKKHAAGIYLGKKGLWALGQNIPLDLAEFHIFRLTYDVEKKLFAFYVDHNPIPAVTKKLAEIKPETHDTERIIFGGTFSSMFQGTTELAYLRWTNRKTLPPDPTQMTAVETVKNKSTPPLPAAKKEPAKLPPVDLNDADIARANQLLTKYVRFPTMAVPMTTKPPTIDGMVDENEWKSAGRMMGLVSYSTRHLIQKPSTFLFQHDDKNVYLAFQLDRPDGVEPKIKTTTMVEHLWNKEDGVELNISPDQEKQAVFSTYVNGASGFSCGYTVRSAGFDTARKGHWMVKSRVTPRGIEGEVQIPKDDFNDVLAAKKLVLDSQTWGFGTMRVDLTPVMEQGDLTDMWGAGGGYKGSVLGRLQFRKDGTAVRLDKMGALDDAHVGMSGQLVGGTDQGSRARLEYTFYHAVRDVKATKIYLYQTWDKVNRIHETGSDFDEGAAVQLLMGENTWLKNLGRCYEVAKEGTLELEVKENGITPFQVSLDQAGGQFIFACRLVGSESNEILWAQTTPVEVKSKLELNVVKRFLTAKGIVALFDVSGSEKAEKGDVVQAVIRGEKDGKAVTNWETTVDNKFLPMEKLVMMESEPAGNYVLEAKLISAKGMEIAGNRKQFAKPEPPSWLNNRIGYSEEVPWPFTEVKADAQQASIWGRTYQWEKGNPFPSKITTQGNELLAAPIELKLVSQGKEIPWERTQWKLAANTKRCATYQSSHTAAGFVLNLTVSVDFDGLMRFRGELQNDKGTPVDSLKLLIPLKKERATHFHASQFETDMKLAERNYKADAIGQFNELFPDGATPFAALFWLGGWQGGIQWIAEWDKGWQNPDRKKVMQVLQGTDQTSLQVSLIGQPTVLKEPLPIDFALNVSPVKDTAYWWKIATVNGASADLRPAKFNPDQGRKDLIRTKENGITHIMTGGFGWPFHADIWVRGHNRPHFKESIDIIHAMGLKVFYYGCWGYSSNGEETDDFGNDMMKIPLQPAGTDTYWYNPEGPWVDFFMAGLDWNIRENGIDGIYLDSMPPTSICADPLIGQTYTDEKGNVHGKWPIFALREWSHRMLNVFHITHQKDGIVYQHDSSVPNLAIVSLADVRCGGEDAPSTYSLRKSWPLDTYLARNDMHVFGIPLETLWYNWWNRPIKENQALSVILLHGQMKNRTGGDYMPYRLKADYELETTPHIAILKLFHGFDIPNAEWWPYYGKQNWISLEPTSLYASSYLHRGKKALIVVSNLDEKPVKAKVTFDLKTAGFKDGAVKVTDAFLKTEVPVEGNVISLDIQGERYRLLLLESVTAP